MSRSKEFFERAQRVIPGGVNSPVRAYGSVGGTPPFIERGQGCRVFDADGRSYIDYVGSWGPLIHGHADGGILRAAGEAMARGTSFGAPTETEVELAELLCDAFPAMDMVRMVSSGTEASMSALRVARGVTGRSRVLKFDGCYHGHADSLLVGAGSGVATLGIPGSPGVPKEFTSLTVQAPFNDLAAVETAFEQWGHEIACVIVEPIAGNMGCIPPLPGFLEGLREVTAADGAVLVFDEVMTGFRVAAGGAQALYGVTPDLTTLGKIVGGGLPVGAFGGRADIMAHIAPEGSVYQAGTLSGNPLAVAAGLTTLNHLTDDVYQQVAEATDALVAGLAERAQAHGHQLATNHVCGMFGIFFDTDRAEHFEHVANSNTEKFNRFFHAMLDRGVYLAPSAYEAGFLSCTHSAEVIAATLDAADQAFAAI